MHDDELIDGAAQAMTRGEPSPLLRDAVRARIVDGRTGVRERGLATRPRQAMARHLWVPALAGAIVILAIAVWRPLLRPPGELVRSTRFASAPLVTPPITLEPAPLGVGPVETSVGASGPARPRPRSLVVDPLVIEPISVPLMAVDSSSGVMPMEIEPLQIEPLQPQ